MARPGHSARSPLGQEPPARLDAGADERIRYIRDTMERAGTFTAVPGWGGVVMGVSALVTAVVAARAPSAEVWCRAWIVDALLAFGIGCAAIAWKARRARSPVVRGPAIRFLLTLAPPLAAGGVLTGILLTARRIDLLPGTWLLLYGTAVATGGASSVPAVPLLGALLMATGTLAFALPAAGNGLMAAGFGVLQIAFGLYIARRHGG